MRISVHHITAVALVTALFVASVPATAQEAGSEDAIQEAMERPTSTVTFYGHVFSHGLDAPMPANTQFPKGESNYGLGSYAWCTEHGRADLTGVDPDQDCHSDPGNKLALFSTAGFVQIASRSDFNQGGGENPYSQIHNERGSAKDIVLDTTKPISAWITMSVDYHGWAVSGGETYCYYNNPPDTGCLYPYWGWDPGYVPGMVVKATLYHASLGAYGSAASEMPPIREAIESGQAVVVAEGATEPTDAMTGLPGSPNFLEFEVDLGTPQIEVIPKESNFFLVYTFYQETPAGDASAHTWRIWAGEFFPPRYTLPVKNAFDVELVVPQFIHDKLAILGLISTPWGSYDVNPDATTITITDEDGNEVTPTRMEAIADYRVAHGAHYKPVNVTFVWDYKADGLEPGTYEVTISAQNNQGSATAECTGKFTVLKGGKAGGIEPGRCGQQTAEEHKAATGEETAPDAGPGGEGRADGGDGDGDGMPELGVQSAGATPVPVFPPVAIIGLALLLGRWRK